LGSKLTEDPAALPGQPAALVDPGLGQLFGEFLFVLRFLKPCMHDGLGGAKI
jgi:hypothetical protein